MTDTKAKKMVVLQVLPELNQGGVELGTIEIASELQKRGIENYVASAGGRMEYQLEHLKVKHFTLPLKTKNIFKMWLNSIRLAKIIRQYGITIVHARSRAPAWSAYWAAKRCGVHFMTTFHGTYGLGPKGIKKFYNKVMTYGERVIAISDHIKAHIIKNYGTAESKIRRISRCVNMDNFNVETTTAERMIKFMEANEIPEDKPIITLIGRLTNWKGQKLLIEALNKIKEEDFYCVLIGDDQGRVKYSQDLRNMIHKYGLDDRFQFIRHVSDIPAAMMVSDVVLSTSIEPEAFGRIAIEGQAMGRVVVASNIGGSVETVLDGVSGFLFESGNPDDLASKISTALHLTTAERDKMGAAGIKNVKENFTKQIMCDKTIAFYEELMNQGDNK
ncbi:MAG: glycosyltransferase family 4 protein [Alphaproteobacteria bacterium]|nr:glycosyltransferase family 4 protein [Alphaproteobacteria bacterium]